MTLITDAAAGRRSPATAVAARRRRRRPGRRRRRLARATGPCWPAGASRRVHMAVPTTARGGRVVGLDARWRAIPRSAACIRRRSGWSARSRDLYGLRPTACPIRGPGSTTEAGASRAARRDAAADAADYAFLPVEGEDLHQIPVGPGACRHHRARPFPLHRRRRDGRAAGAAARLRAQGRWNRCMPAATSPAGAARRTHLRRQHGRLRLRLRRAPPRRPAASTPPPRAVWLRGADGRAGAAWPTISAMSARSATTPPSASCWRIAACCASACCAPPPAASATG